ncbi:Transmembrane_domain-containing protein [Hexamita inflata]|uniref:Transmembrane domain-containing protein n=2 Tax=Hexamita inflata TaxID=28002 RepID=A0AA86RN02_9EUKA|nr:Transmembrane domain-containing protein [Hexamita inflata]CAI9969410.1 Transmembrane domain-containing protein [Hexamita inflata]
MTFKSENKSQSTQIALSFLLIIWDMIILGVAAVVLIFAIYFFTGLNVDKFMEMGPLLQSEVAVQVCYAGCFLYYPKVQKFNAKLSKYVAFAFYYSYLWVTAYASIYATKLIIDYIWFERTGSQNYDGNANASIIGFHQVLTFILCTSHNLWFNGKLLQGIDPFAQAILTCIATWCIHGIWANHFVALDNRNQVGGFTQWIPLTNLMAFNIFGDLSLEKVFKNTGTRAGYLALATNLVNIASWGVCYGITYAIFKSEELNNVVYGGSIWGMATISWPAYQVIGHRFSPVVCKKMCLNDKQEHRWFMVFVYFIICSILALIVGAGFYLFFQYVMFDSIICKVLKYKGDEAVCLATKWYNRPLYLFGFGVGTEFSCYLEIVPHSRDGIKPAQEQVEKAEVIIQQPICTQPQSSNIE